MTVRRRSAGSARAQRSKPRRSVGRPADHRRRRPPSSGSRCWSARRGSGGRRRRCTTLRPRRSPPGRWLAQRVEVEQRLRRVGVPAVAGVDHAGRRSARAARSGAPLRRWRMTRMAAPSASSVRTVSMSDSPLASDAAGRDPDDTGSPPSACAASSKETRVRVEASRRGWPRSAAQRRHVADRPRDRRAISSAGAHHQVQLARLEAVHVEQMAMPPADRPDARRDVERPAHRPMPTARRSRTALASTASRPALGRRARSATAADSLDDHLVLAVDLVEVDPDDLLAWRRHVLADVVGADGQLAMAAIDEHRQADGRGRPKSTSASMRGADRAAGVEHVVDDHERRRLEVERQVGALDDAAAAPRRAGRRGRR